MSLNSLILIVAGGAVAGTFGVMLGLGGGVFLIPFLVLVLDVPMHQAIAASIVAVIATSSTGAAMNVERRTVNIRLAMLLEVTTVGGAIAGGLTASILEGPLLAKIFGGILIVVSVMMALRTRLQRAFPVAAEGTNPVLRGTYFDSATGAEVSYHVGNVPGTMIISLIAGNISGLLGVGGGFFKVPAMYLLSGVPLKAAAATSNFMIGVTAAAGAFIYFSEGFLNPQIAAPAALGVMIGSFFGVRIGGSLRQETLSWIFSAVLLFVAYQLFTRT